MSRFDNPAPSTSAGQLKEKAQEVGSQVKAAAQEQLGRLRDTAGEYYEQGKEKAMEWEGNVEEYVRQQPLKSVLIAAGVGLVLGILWRRS